MRLRVGNAGDFVRARANAVASVLRLLALRAAIPPLVKHGHLPSLLARLDKFPRSASRDADGVAERLLRPVGLWRPTCLYRALVRYAACRSAGVDVQFVIGVCINGDDVNAHAWLERDGAPYREPAGSTQGYTVAFTYPRDKGSIGGKEMPIGALTASADVLLTEMNDGTGLLLDLRSKFYFTLNATGVLIWKRIAAGGADGPDDLARSLVETFPGVALPQLRADASALLDEFVAEGLVATAPAAAK